MKNRRPFVQEPPASGLADPLGDATSLTCPRCGDSYLHLIHTSHDGNDETMLDFECEGCGGDIQMSFQSRKGHAYMSWVF